MNQPHEVYLIDTPWIIQQYLMTDAEADANGGKTVVGFECCICGTTERQELLLPPENDPVWETIDPKTGLPEANRLRQNFQLAHLHPDKHANPMLDWAKPLRNPAALKSGINLEQLHQRLLRELNQGGDRDG